MREVESKRLSETPFFTMRLLVTDKGVQAEYDYNGPVLNGIVAPEKGMKLLALAETLVGVIRKLMEAFGFDGYIISDTREETDGNSNESYTRPRSTIVH